MLTTRCFSQGSILRTALVGVSASLLCVLSTACISYGKATIKDNLSLSRYVSPATATHPSAVQHLSGFGDVLAGFGFVLLPRAEPGHPQMRVDFNPNAFNLTVRVSLWSEGEMIAQGEGHNFGFGSAIARPVAIGNVTASAIAHFEKQLRSVMPRISFKDEAPPSSLQEPSSQPASAPTSPQ
jgi:hypothetical protein